MQCKRCKATVAGYDEPPEWCPNCDPNNLIAAATQEPPEEVSALELLGEPSVTLTVQDLAALTTRATLIAPWQAPIETRTKHQVVVREAWLDGYARAVINIMNGLQEMTK